jgi:hypothetical protein
MELPRNTPRTPADFADVIWGDYASGYLTVALKPTDSNKNFQILWGKAHSLYKFAKDAAFFAKDNDVYFGISCYQRKSRNLESVKNCNWLWADLDDHALSSDVPLPTILVETSSNRRQALWAIKEETSVGAIEDAVRAIAFASGLGNEAVKANQVLRVPGTTNHKQGRENWRVYIEDYYPDALYEMKDFSHLAPAPTSLSETALVTLISMQEAYELWFGAYHQLSLRMKRVAYCHPEITKLNGKQYKSASEGDMALITGLVRAGYSPEEAGGMFLVSKRGKWCVERHGYIEARQRASLHAAGAATLITVPSSISIPLSIFTAGLDPIAIAVYVVQAQYAFNNERSFCGSEKISDVLSLDPDTVLSARKRLVDAGLLIPDGTVQRANRYRFTKGESLLVAPSLLEMLCSRSNAKGVAIVLAILAGFTTQKELQGVFATTRQMIARAIPELVKQNLVSINIGARNQQNYVLSPDVTKTGAM